MIAFGIAICLLCVSNLIAGYRITRLENRLNNLIKVTKWDRS